MTPARSVASCERGETHFKNANWIMQAILTRSITNILPKFAWRWPVRNGALLAGMILCLANLAPAQLPGWALGPFVRPAGAGPIIKPDTNAVFFCPMRGRPVHWEALHTFNPAAVVQDDQVWLLYRAEDDSGTMAIGQHTSRLGLALSDDGIHFQTRPAPVFYPVDDSQKADEWDGGCEDPRVVETEDGTFVLLYTQWNRKNARLAVATSKNLLLWKKYGPIFPKLRWSKSASIVCRVANGRLLAAKINGKYWMYWGEGTIACATSDDLIHWQPGPALLKPRNHKFDSILAEAGPPAVLTTNGIVLLYNGKNRPQSGDPGIGPNAYAVGQALFDAKDPAHLLARLDQPCFKPEAAFERTGQYQGGTTFAEGLVYFHKTWFLYYGCADSLVGVAAWHNSK
jgi:predicted GH43/DUF377 family glycosyl hydrolase